MQFKGYRINNLKSYRKYFCLSDAAEALENGAYQEWLTGVSELSEHGEAAVGEDVKIIGEIRRLLDHISGCKDIEWQRETESQSVGRHYENIYKNLFMMFFALAHMPVTEEDREEIARIARFEAEKRTGLEQKKNRKKDSGVEIFVNGDKYGIQVWNNKTRQEEIAMESRTLFRWRKLVNAGTVPLSVLLMDEECIEVSRCLNPGGYVWMLTLNGCFVKWGSRVQVDHRSFACVDRNGCLSVNGYPMQGADMVDFSFDQRTGILGVDGSGNLRQYSGLDLEMRSEGESEISAGDGLNSNSAKKEKIAFACLDGKTYILVKENGELITNLTDGPADFFSWQAENGEITKYPAKCAGDTFCRIVSVSEQLAGFETPDSRVGVWDRERKQLLWIEQVGRSTIKRSTM